MLLVAVFTGTEARRQRDSKSVTPGEGMLDAVFCETRSSFFAVAGCADERQRLFNLCREGILRCFCPHRHDAAAAISRDTENISHPGCNVNSYIKFLQKKSGSHPTSPEGSNERSGPPMSPCLYAAAACIKDIVNFSVFDTSL